MKNKLQKKIVVIIIMALLLSNNATIAFAQTKAIPSTSGEEQPPEQPPVFIETKDKEIVDISDPEIEIIVKNKDGEIDVEVGKIEPTPTVVVPLEPTDNPIFPTEPVKATDVPVKPTEFDKTPTKSFEPVPTEPSKTFPTSTPFPTNKIPPTEKPFPTGEVIPTSTPTVIKPITATPKIVKPTATPTKVPFVPTKTPMPTQKLVPITPTPTNPIIDVIDRINPFIPTPTETPKNSIPDVILATPTPTIPPDQTPIDKIIKIIEPVIPGPFRPDPTPTPDTSLPDFPIATPTPKNPIIDIIDKINPFTPDPTPTIIIDNEPFPPGFIPEPTSYIIEPETPVETLGKIIDDFFNISDEPDESSQLESEAKEVSDLVSVTRNISQPSVVNSFAGDEGGNEEPNPSVNIVREYLDDYELSVEADNAGNVIIERADVSVKVAVPVVLHPQSRQFSIRTDDGDIPVTYYPDSIQAHVEEQGDIDADQELTLGFSNDDVVYVVDGCESEFFFALIPVCTQKRMIISARTLQVYDIKQSVISRTVNAFSI